MSTQPLTYSQFKNLKHYIIFFATIASFFYIPVTGSYSPLLNGPSSTPIHASGPELFNLYLLALPVASSSRYNSQYQLFLKFFNCTGTDGSLLLASKIPSLLHHL